MPNTVNVQNNFIGGLKTEFTGLNFPENAATDTDNCIYTLIGDVTRREGIDYETSSVQTGIDRTNSAISTYKWNNVGGDGLTQVVVQQVGNTLYFYKSSSATTAAPVSAQRLAATITLTSFRPAGSAVDPSVTECQYSDGNGYLFVFHPDLDPFYCTYNAGTIVGNAITVQTRDFDGVAEPTVADNSRPPAGSIAITTAHSYNLSNQGWGKNYNAPFVQGGVTLGATNIFNIGVGVPALLGDTVRIADQADGTKFTIGTVISYAAGVLTINIVSFAGAAPSNNWIISPEPNRISIWANAIGNFPANSDVWWNYKDSSNNFTPATTINRTTLNAGPSPKGYWVLSTFNQDRAASSGITLINPITTFVRPRTGTWFQGRVWYAGVDASTTTTLTSSGFSTWTENIYFSQIITSSSQFGRCYQVNDPTSETLFDLLPSDGGVITIQGSGSIYKLFPVQNGLLVFAANGIWFVTGSQGIGFSATDYTITKISAVQSISSIPFVNVLGYPMFWNEEGIYSVNQDPKGAGLIVDNLCIGTILSYYATIPIQSKKYARGDYNPIDFTIQWTFKSTDETTITSRYEFDRLLNLNTANKAFYPYSITGVPKIHGIVYVTGPGGTTTPSPTFKYVVSRPFAASYQFSFAEEHDSTHHVDWFQQDNIGVNYTSYFVTGYRIAGKALTKWQPLYIYMFLRNEGSNAYKIQGIWDFANTGNSGRYSTVQVIADTNPKFNMLYKRHKIRGHGLVLQLKVASVDGRPFDIMGWSSLEQTNQGT